MKQAPLCGIRFTGYRIRGYSRSIKIIRNLVSTEKMTKHKMNTTDTHTPISKYAIFCDFFLSKVFDFYKSILNIYKKTELTRYFSKS